MRLKNSSIQVRIFEFREEPTSAIHLKWYRLWFALLTLLSTAGSLSIAIIRGTIDNWLDSPAIVTELLVAAFAANLFFATEFISKTKMTDFGLSLNAPFIACLAARKMHRLENDFKAHGSEKQAARAQALIGIRRSYDRSESKSLKRSFLDGRYDCSVSYLTILLTLKKPS